MSELNSGERQVAPVVEGIRADHRARYQFVVDQYRGLEPQRIIDVGCGIGYGAKALVQAGHKVVAVDRSEEAIAFAGDHYADPNLVFVIDDVNSGLMGFDNGRFDVAVCFEIIEHLEYPDPVLQDLRRIAKTLAVSVPNEDAFPFRSAANDFQGYKFHFQHYTRDQLQALLTRNGWKIVAWYGQEGPESGLTPELMTGRTLIATAVHSNQEPEAPPVRHLTGRPTDRPSTTSSSTMPHDRAPAPEHVAILGLGRSLSSFVDVTKRLGGIRAYCDEVWGVNAAGDIVHCDRVFHMDDVRIQEARAAAAPDSNIARMLDWLRRHPGPIYTSRVREGYPGLVEYPLQDVLNADEHGNGGAPYFNSTPPYAVAFAIHIGVKRLSLFGCDYSLENVHNAERGRGCLEYWLGVAAARGVQITLPETTALMDANVPERELFYGYDCVNVHLQDRDDGGIAVTFEERADDAIPTVAEIERRYDHRRHPNPHVREEQER